MATAAIIDTSVANIASMKVALERIGLSAEITRDVDKVGDAERVVLPGVGSFGTGMARIRELNLGDSIRQRILNDRPTLSVCLGMQLLGRQSEEDPNVEGLGIWDTGAIRFPSQQPVPQLGWNQVIPEPTNAAEETVEVDWVQPGNAYFANSFCLTEIGPGWNVAKTHYGIDFVSAAWKGRVLCCQFHPELSGRWGLDLLRQWAFPESRSLSGA